MILSLGLPRFLSVIKFFFVFFVLFCGHQLAKISGSKSLFICAQALRLPFSPLRSSRLCGSIWPSLFGCGSASPPPSVVKFFFVFFVLFCGHQLASISGSKSLFIRVHPWLSPFVAVSPFNFGCRFPRCLPLVSAVSFGARHCYPLTNGRFCFRRNARANSRCQ